MLLLQVNTAVQFAGATGASGRYRPKQRAHRRRRASLQDPQRQNAAPGNAVQPGPPVNRPSLSARRIRRRARPKRPDGEERETAGGDAGSTQRTNENGEPVNQEGLTEAEQREVQKLKARDREVRAVNRRTPPWAAASPGSRVTPTRPGRMAGNTPLAARSRSIPARSTAIRKPRSARWSRSSAPPWRRCSPPRRRIAVSPAEAEAKIQAARQEIQAEKREEQAEQIREAPRERTGRGRQHRPVRSAVQSRVRFNQPVAQGWASTCAIGTGLAAKGELKRGR